MGENLKFREVARELTKTPHVFFDERPSSDSLLKPFLCNESSADIAFDSLFLSDN